MASNDQIMLDNLLAQERAGVAPDQDESDFFEFFVAEQVLRSYDLSYEEIESGLVDGGNDGGIDAIYSFVNGELVSDDTEPGDRVQEVELHLVVIQASTRRGFKGAAVDQLVATTGELLDLSRALGDFRTNYNQKLIGILENFRRVYTSAASKFPRLVISYHYATKGEEVHPGVQRKAKALERTLAGLFSRAECSFRFLGARELLDLSDRPLLETRSLAVAETPISTDDRGFICLVHLRDYFGFITDTPKAELCRAIFEANVRDYEGLVEVNKAIRETLEEPGDEDFWWLNNGITVVAGEASLAGKTLTVKEPQVVNGLQTSLEIYKYFRERQDPVDDRKVLVRVIVVSRDESRNSIIKATNNQIRISPASFRATDPFQRDIERYLQTRELFYERRKNYYKNLGKPKDRIISIAYLAQAVMAIVLQEPNNARGRPTTLIKSDEHYERIFASTYPIALYFDCATLMKGVDDFLRRDAPAYARAERSNLRFHLAMFASALRAGRSEVRPQDIPSIGLDQIDSPFLEECLTHVWEVFEELRSRQDADRVSDRIAKSRDFDDALKERLAQIFEEAAS